MIKDRNPPRKASLLLMSSTSLLQEVVLSTIQSLTHNSEQLKITTNLLSGVVSGYFLLIPRPPGVSVSCPTFCQDCARGPPSYTLARTRRRSSSTQRLSRNWHQENCRPSLGSRLRFACWSGSICSPGGGFVTHGERGLETVCCSCHWEQEDQHGSQHVRIGPR